MVLTYGSPLFEETDTATTVRDAIRALLGPKPQVNTILGSGGNGVPYDIEAQKNALIAYRVKVVALIKMLESGVMVCGSVPITGPAGRNLSGLRKPITAARASRRRHAA